MAGRRTAATRDDVAEDRATLLWGTGIIALGYAVGASVQSAWIYAELVPGWAQVDLWRRLVANGLAVVVLVAVLGVLRTHRSSGVGVAVRLLVAALLMAALRVGVQVLVGVHAAQDREELTIELASGAGVALIAAVTGVCAMVSRRRMRAATRAAERQSMSVELAVQALEDEEIRVRRRVAEGLHGTVQQRLVLIDAHLAGVQERLGDTDPLVAVGLASARAELARSRDIDVREMSRLLYPDRLEMGLVPAVRALLGRVPATIATRLVVGDALRAADDPSRVRLTVAERLLAVRVVEEALSNALKHGPASQVDIGLDLLDDRLHIVVANDGGPYVTPADRDPVSGTTRLHERLQIAGGWLRVEADGSAGTRLEAVLPLGALAAVAG